MSVDEKKPSLRQRNHERIQQRILEVALALFTTEGYDQTTMDAIAEQAEVGRATLFKYFPTKSSLLLPVSQQVLFAELRPKVQALLERQPSTTEALSYYFELIGQRMQELSDVTRALVNVIGLVQDDSSGRVPDFSATLMMILQYGQRRGEVRQDISLELLSSYISCLYGMIVNKVVKNDEIEEYLAAVRTLLSFVASGLAEG